MRTHIVCHKITRPEFCLGLIIRALFIVKKAETAPMPRGFSKLKIHRKKADYIILGKCLTLVVTGKTTNKFLPSLEKAPRKLLQCLSRKHVHLKLYNLGGLEYDLG